MKLFPSTEDKLLERLTLAVERIAAIMELGAVSKGGTSLRTLYTDGQEEASVVSYVSDRDQFLEEIKQEEVIMRGGLPPAPPED